MLSKESARQPVESLASQGRLAAQHRGRSRQLSARGQKLAAGSRLECPIVGGGRRAGEAAGGARGRPRGQRQPEDRIQLDQRLVRDQPYRDSVSRICKVRRSDSSYKRSQHPAITLASRQSLPPAPATPAVVLSSRLRCAVLTRRYITENDLSFFKAHMEQNVVVEGATNWEPMMNRDFGSFTYTAWRRILPVSLLYRTCTLLAMEVISVQVQQLTDRLRAANRDNGCLLRLLSAVPWVGVSGASFLTWTTTQGLHIHPQTGKAEYKSVTVSLDATAEEFIDFYFDDPTRPTWVCAQQDSPVWLFPHAISGCSSAHVQPAPMMLCSPHRHCESTLPGPFGTEAGFHDFKAFNESSTGPGVTGVERVHRTRW